MKRDQQTSQEEKEEKFRTYAENLHHLVGTKNIRGIYKPPEHYSKVEKSRNLFFRNIETSIILFYHQTSFGINKSTAFVHLYLIAIPCLILVLVFQFIFILDCHDVRLPG